ncbi:MAG: hypothetical protein JSV35_04810 [Candidatus Bathyarchaeota archaeon]|nr:MAG: hypothetical protein JSV35_04810 [Candidatus Bathyarchaeota archaeon]
MTEEPEDKVVSPEKLLIDQPSDFQFHAAYVAYSEAYDNASNPETQEQLNKMILALQQKEIDHRTFYETLDRHRSAQQDFRRPQIKTQRKRDWRRQTQRRERNKRHRK